MIGVIVNVLAVALGGVLGTVFSKKLSTRFTTELNKVFGVCAIGMGISSVPLMQNMPAVTSLVAVPQAAVFFALFFAAKAIYPLTTPTMIGDFKACGGFLLIATGCRIAKMQDFPVADMIPAMVLVMPLSALWTKLHRAASLSAWKKAPLPKKAAVLAFLRYVNYNKTDH